MTSPSLVAITSFFNPTGSRRRLENYRRFRAALRVPLIAVELGYGQDYELGDADAEVLIRRRGRDVLWQKERLLNLALEHVPPGTYAVAWLDADVVAERDDWAHAVVDALERDPIVQVFQEARDVSAEGPTGRVRHSLAHGVRAGLIRPDQIGSSEHLRKFGLATGLGWAARMDLLRRHGLYDACIVGGGDRAIACAAFGSFVGLAAVQQWTAAQEARYLAWADNFCAEVGGRVGVVDGVLSNLTHGTLKARRRRERHEILARFDFDPSVDIVHDESGCWRFSGDKPGLEREIRAYFEARQD